MREDLENKLVEKFAFMKRSAKKRTGGVRNRYQTFGVEAKDGWYPLLYELCEELSKCIHDADEQVKFVVLRIKEKYGILRFYYYLEGGGFEIRDQIDEIVDRYERLSATVCECCGKPGKLRDVHGQIMVRCEECYREIAENPD